MPKGNKPEKKGKQSASPETSKTPFSADLDPDFIATLLELEKSDRKEIGDMINDVLKKFGTPHLHGGIGIRDLGRSFYEFRVGLAKRVVFQRVKSGLYFHFMGDHDEVKKFLKKYK